MSKNVAVFVDVANIFYAAKAAGVDIDYVTLLKSATAGRDFVRAYAYTGLDPENENQRQFHAFLVRSGYKVVSKDIRKYGDGRIKANLDIELVVDLMRMAEKLDVAVVVSGDGDFAPAIYAVQQQGVRVEVISFRGNTSTDLIDAADVFIDIANIAKVEKGARSGRRVATEGDLSMTEVPDKESGVTPRRRTRDEERPERAARPARRRGARGAEAREVDAAPSQEGGAATGLVALPGEKLSRPAAAVEEALVAPEDDAGEMMPESDDQSPTEDGRRRRRRRGGRGRGRGAREEQSAETQPEDVRAEVTAYPDEVPTLPQHSGFGSVWESQLGAAVPGAPGTIGGTFDETVPDEGFEAEPDVPEYLVAERRRQDQRRGGHGGRGGGYRTAIDRERFGVGTRSAFGRGPGRGGRSARPPLPGRATQLAMEPIEQTPGGDPWSEVPPDVQKLLRAELARRGGPPDRPIHAPVTRALAAGTPAEEVPSKPATRTRRTRVPAATAAVETTAAEAPTAAEEPTRATRARRTSKAATTVATDRAPEASATEGPEAADKPGRSNRTRRTTKAGTEAPEA